MSRRALGVALAPVLVALAAASSCASTSGDGYLDAMASAERALHAGRYREAAHTFSEAASRAERIKDRDEARLMEARSLQRAEAWNEARASYERLIRDSPTGPRSTRAEFELAGLAIERGDAEAGWAMLLAATQRHPSHGLARNALRKLIDREESRGGPKAALAWLGQHGPLLRGTELDQDVTYSTGLLLERSGDREGAVRALLEAARTHPYPKGGLTDEALFHAARVAVDLARPKDAIAYLREMLAAREDAATGSYDRGSFDDAQLEIARIYRDVIGDRGAARQEFRRLYAGFPASRLRDDALWAEVKLWREDGNEGEACATMKLLVRALPESRYVRCAQAVCPSMPAAERPCAAYILQELRGEPED